MSEITKLYENAGIKADRIVCYRGFDNCINNDFNCHCHNEKPCKDAAKIYPQFTAEKQLLLLQLLARIESADYFQFFFYEIKQEWVFRLNMLTELSCESAYIYESRNKNFDECIAGLINIIWQDLTEEEKQQVKGILE